MAEPGLWADESATYHPAMHRQHIHLASACSRAPAWRVVAATAALACGCDIKDEAVQPTAPTADRLLRADALEAGGLLGAATGGPPVAKAPTIEYVEGFDAAALRAAAEARPLLVVCRASWCRWSAELLQGPLADPRIIELSRRFVCVMVDADRHADTCRKLGVQAFPTVLFLAPDGTERTRTVGRPTVDTLTASLESTLRPTIAAGPTPRSR